MSQMIECGVNLRASARDATSMEEAAARIVALLYEELVQGETKAPCLVLARLYKTHPYGRLPLDLQEFARSVFPDHTLTDQTRCLTLLATCGVEPAWRSRRSSRGHKAIPLPSVGVVEQLPMIAQLVRQLGLDVAEVVSPRPSLILDMQQRSFNVFHVPEALGSPFIPAQKDFVERHGVRSVLGFGGALHDGDIFACILFSRAAITRDVAGLFHTVALNVRLSLLPFVGGQVFVS
jgi:hypothetical protein